jgi:hypothetical protein
VASTPNRLNGRSAADVVVRTATSGA